MVIYGLWNSASSRNYNKTTMARRIRHDNINKKNERSIIRLVYLKNSF